MNPFRLDIPVVNEAGKMLLVKEEIVNTALERTLTAGDLVRETIVNRNWSSCRSFTPAG